MSNNSDSLGDRMKTYEDVTRYKVIRRTPVIVRLDGRAFHTFTKRLKDYDDTLANTPFSILMHSIMTETALAVMMGMQNAVFAYTQSDEISILLRDWDTHETQQWFDGVVQKICSISAALASTNFSYYFMDFAGEELARHNLVTFDSRVYNLPKEEVCNYFIWRQQDASRNSVQMLGRHYFSQKIMHRKNLSQIQDMLMLEKGVNWNDIKTWMKRGSCIHTSSATTPEGVNFNTLVVDEDIPIFTQDRNYVERHLEVLAK
jgi:tRNA(His) 5'-end guanylyltransferase